MPVSLNFPVLYRRPYQPTFEESFRKSAGEQAIPTIAGVGGQIAQDFFNASEADKRRAFEEKMADANYERQVNAEAMRQGRASQARSTEQLLGAGTALGLEQERGRQGALAAEGAREGAMDLAEFQYRLRPRGGGQDPSKVYERLARAAAATGSAEGQRGAEEYAVKHGLFGPAKEPSAWDRFTSFFRGGASGVTSRLQSEERQRDISGQATMVAASMRFAVQRELAIIRNNTVRELAAAQDATTREAIFMRAKQASAATLARMGSTIAFDPTLSQEAHEHLRDLDRMAKQVGVVSPPGPSGLGADTDPGRLFGP